MNIILKGCKKNITTEMILPGDKSIAHRSLIIGAIPKGNYTIENFPKGEDCLATATVMECLGVSIVSHENKLLVKSPGVGNFNNKVGNLDCKNSGTTARLISGLISGANICTTLVGDESLSKRPMKRIVNPLREMGANIVATEGTLPIIFKENNGLKAMVYELPVPSAQVKSAVLIGGFLASGNTKVIEPIPTRDHTERLFEFLGAKITRKGNEISIENSVLESKDIYVPGDSSSAAFLIGCALLGENIKLTIKNMLLSEGRTEYLKVLLQMGAKIEINSKGEVNKEPIGDVIAYSSKLKGVTIDSNLTPSIIDEIPALSVIAAFSEGETVFQKVEELKYKECDRINAIINNLKKLNVECIYDNNNLYIRGKSELELKDKEKVISIDSFMDHRIAMAFTLLAMKLENQISINNWECTSISFPRAEEYFNKLINFKK